MKEISEEVTTEPSSAICAAPLHLRRGKSKGIVITATIGRAILKNPLPLDFLQIGSNSCRSLSGGTSWYFRQNRSRSNQLFAGTAFWHVFCSFGRAGGVQR